MATAWPMSRYRPLTVRLSRRFRRDRPCRVQSPPMSNRSRRDAAARAEARRRARLASQGIEPEPAEDEPSAAATRRGTAPQGGFLQRLFPPAAPLPGKPDPLAGFSYDGRARTVASTLYLLRRYPLPWVAAGVLFGLCYLVMFRPGTQIVYSIASILSFVVLIAAGWVGWQRPWAFGLAASVLGYLLFLVVGLPTGWIESPPSVPTSSVVLSVTFSGLFQAVIGVVAGFYGGYLRRRMAEPRPGTTQRRRR